MIFLIAIKLELIPIFIDESGFINENTNFYSWIAKDFSIYSNVDKIEKFNLLMAVNPNKVWKKCLDEFMKFLHIECNNDLFIFSLKLTISAIIRI